MLYTQFEYPIASLFFLLIAWHAIADYPLQSDFIATAKNRNTELGKMFWMWVLPAHSFIHGVGVMLITGSVILGIIETIAHFFIDLLKCDNRITLNQDQMLHLATKVIILLLVLVKMA